MLPQGCFSSTLLRWAACWFPTSKLGILKIAAVKTVRSNARSLCSVVLWKQPRRHLKWWNLWWWLRAPGSAQGCATVSLQRLCICYHPGRWIGWQSRLWWTQLQSSRSAHKLVAHRNSCPLGEAFAAFLAVGSHGTWGEGVSGPEISAVQD